MDTFLQLEAIPAAGSCDGAGPPRRHMILLLLATWLLLCAALLRTLPLLPDADEAIFVEAAVRIASSGNLDPGFYGNPGTTLMYPLALGAHLWHALSQQGTLLRPDPNLWPHFVATQWPYYFLGRMITVAFGLLSVAFTVHVGRRVAGAGAQGWRIGLAAGWFFAVTPLVVYHARLVRTDSVATASGMLALYLLLRLLDAPSLRLHVAAGAAIGIAMAGRYFMVALVAPLLLVDLLLLQRSRRVGRPPFGWGAALLGALAIPIFFLLAVPTMATQFAEVMLDLRVEARSTHMGADGLSFFGNLRWYLTTGFIESLLWPLALVTWAGLLLVLYERKLRPLLMLLYVATFLIGISLSPLHWHRWLIPILPVLMIFAAMALDRLVKWPAPHNSAPASASASVWYGVGVCLLLAWPLGRSILMDVRDAGPNTRLQARTWMLATLPAQSRILQESYGAPLDGTPLHADAIRALSDVGEVSALRSLGYDYVVASSAIYDRVFAEPDRYATEIDFYNTLFAGDAAQIFAPAWYESGPTIQIFKP